MAQALEKAVREYQAKNLPKALSLATQLLGKSRADDAGLFALIGKIQFELGNKQEAADAFIRAGEGTANAANLFKLAVTLYGAVGADARIVEFGARAVELNPTDGALAYAVSMAMFRMDRVELISPLVPYLDLSNDQHLAMVFAHYQLMEDYATPIAFLDQALAKDPQNPMLLSQRFIAARETCDMPVLERFQQIMSRPGEMPASDILRRELLLHRLAWSDDEALNVGDSHDQAECRNSLMPLEHFPRRTISAPGTRLKVGYLSYDFFDHATMTLLLDTLAHHDEAAVDIYLLSYAPAAVASDRDGWPQKLKDRIVRLEDKSDIEAAAIIDGLGIDILVDLKGHTMCARLHTFNLARAPIKVTYLGYPGALTGVDVDYVISDATVTPDSSRPHYVEKFCRMPETYQANSCERRAVPRPTSRQAHGIPQDAFVFAALNNPNKITPQRLRLWAAVLRAVPGSLLWCMSGNAIAAENLRAAFEREGIARDRILVSPRVPYADNLGRAQLADLALDTAPYNGHTTTSDMLWVGLPVVATRGNSFASRVSASLLQAIGLPDLVAQDNDAFVALAVALARDPERRAALRRRIADARFTAPLFDAERFARHLERAYELMAARARVGLAPDHIDVPALPPRKGSFAPR